MVQMNDLNIRTESADQDSGEPMFNSFRRMQDKWNLFLSELLFSFIETPIRALRWQLAFVVTKV